MFLPKFTPFPEELRLKRMAVRDESLEFLAKSFHGFKVLSLLRCDGFSTDGISSIAFHCKSLTELDIQENGMDDISGSWLSCFPDDFASLEVLNFASLNSEISIDALKRLVSRCKSLRVLKVNKNVTLSQLQRLLIRAPQLIELGTGCFLPELTSRQYAELESAFSNCKNLHTISGVGEFSKLLAHCPNLRRLWVLDTVKDEGLEAVGTSCPLLEELRVFPANPFEEDIVHGVTELGFVAVSTGCPKLQYVLYFCQQMTNAAVAMIVHNCPDFTHFRLCIMNPGQPDYMTSEPMDEAFGAVYAKNLETLSVAFAGSSDWGMLCVLEGCSKLRKLEIRGCPFGNAALLSGLEKYESMRCLWMSACSVTMNGCRLLAQEKPRLNVEVIKDENRDDFADKLYVHRSVAGPRRDVPPFVVTL
ncbi:hypothetical protein FXO38_20519 [Capsicum annuum]|nr:hypothetical protein FXO37_28043 [Capsicum annuum]KAF3643705.1 hypothetical protein FXO38_20519 [Capsicum annuum]